MVGWGRRKRTPLPSRGKPTLSIAQAKRSRARADAAADLLAGPWTYTSGQKKWSDDNLRLLNDMVIISFAQTISRAIDYGFDSIVEFFAILSPSIAFKTGRLRAAYLEKFNSWKFLYQQMNRAIKSNREPLKTFEISTGFIQILEAVDYAKYHITEFSGVKSYAEPTTGGTFPLSLNDITLTIGGIIEEMIPRQFLLEGWDLKVLSDFSRGAFF